MFDLKYILMKRIYLFSLLALFSLISLAQNQTKSDSLRKDAVKLFIDCQFCDMNHIRREIPYVNYVRDVKEAEVYMRVSSDSTGSGGRKYSIIFLVFLSILIPRINRFLIIVFDLGQAKPFFILFGKLLILHVFF